MGYLKMIHHNGWSSTTSSSSKRLHMVFLHNYPPPEDRLSYLVPTLQEGLLLTAQAHVLELMAHVPKLEEARKARLSGADSLFIKKELIDAALAKHGPNRMYAIKQLCDQLSYLTSNDD
eukprot:1156662-Pelagomonas_calceolata.AAC.29